jgi:Fic family protein
LLLHHEGLMPQPLLYLSAYLERHRAEYYRLLLAVSQQGLWTEWIRFFVEGVRAEARDALARSAMLLDLRERYSRKLERARTSALGLRAADLIFETPVVSIRTVAERLGVTFRSAAQHVERLERANILKEVTRRERGRVFVAQKIIDIVEAREVRS